MKEYLTPEETAAAYGELGAAAWLKIQRAAAILARSKAAGRDLAQDAIGRAIVGERNCPRDLDLVAFTVQVMRSIISAEAKAFSRTKRVPFDGIRDSELLEAAEKVGQRTAEDLLSDEEEDELFCQGVANVKQQVLALFNDDDKTRFVAEGIMEGMEGIALCDLVSIDANELATKRRLIRRRIGQAFPDGWQYDV